MQLSSRHFVKTGDTFRVIGFTTMGKYRATAEVNAQNLPERIVTWIPEPGHGRHAGRDPLRKLARCRQRRDVPASSTCTRAIIAFVRGMNFMNLHVSQRASEPAQCDAGDPDSVRNARLRRSASVAASSRPACGCWPAARTTASPSSSGTTSPWSRRPLDDARTNAVIAEVKRVIPNKPIRYLLNTHHHWDHSGGTRAYAAEGAIIVTHEGNEDFYEDVVLAPQARTLSPTGCRSSRLRRRAPVRHPRDLR